LPHKGHSSLNNPKKRHLRPVRKFSLPNHNGLLKRIRIVGPRHARRFKFKSPGSRHLNRNSSKRNLKQKKRDRYIAECDMERIKKMIPYYKNQKFKAKH